MHPLWEQFYFNIGSISYLHCDVYTSCIYRHGYLNSYCQRNIIDLIWFFKELKEKTKKLDRTNRVRHGPVVVFYYVHQKSLYQLRMLTLFCFNVFV